MVIFPRITMHRYLKFILQFELNYCMDHPILSQKSLNFPFSNLLFSGESATHYLVKNTVRTFKELGVRM